MDYSVKFESDSGDVHYDGLAVALSVDKDSDNAFFKAVFSFNDWEKDAYILLPACVYDGNRFKKIKCKYPPMYEKQDCAINPEPIISDIPALSTEGKEKIEVTSGDLSVPCVCIYYKKKKESLFIFTEQECGGKNIGYSVEDGRIEIQFPAMRSRCYRMCRNDEPSSDSGFDAKRGQVFSSGLIIKSFHCSSITQFFKLFFENRRLLMSSPCADTCYTEELWGIMEEHMNNDNFSGEYYAEISKKWQCGWVGGILSSLPLLQYGSELSKSRAIKTADFLSNNISQKGFFYGIIENGEILDDGFGREHMKNAILTRKNGDALYYLIKHFYCVNPKEVWINAAKKCASAFLEVYRRYGNFGQFISCETGEMLYGGTTSGASVISALALFGQYFNLEEYLDTAMDAFDKYYNDFIAKGLCYAGPGEALCAPDSESTYAMLDAAVLLYEITNDSKYLDCAIDCFHLFSSWVMTYAYRFPKGCEFERLGINTVGSVFANAQNKHSAPGICTASGLAIYKLYKYTGNESYLSLLIDIVKFIPQCVSTKERPIFSWDREKRALPLGWICERVNTSDWEGNDKIGQVFYGSCWCETSLLLTFSELINNEETKSLFLKH